MPSGNGTQHSLILPRISLSLAHRSPTSEICLFRAADFSFYPRGKVHWQQKAHRHSEHLPLLAVRQMYNALLQMHVTTSGKMPPKVPLPAKNLNFHLIMAPCVHTSQPPKRHGDRFSCVGGGAHRYDQHTDRQTTERATCVAST